ncbi:MAG: TetR/AcrR family transcriptional regulator [Eubacteriales bacterium]
MKKSEKTEITVAKIVESAMAEFGTNGYSGGTVNNISKSGINKGLIYHNFTGKDQIYLICLKHSCEKLTEYIRESEGTADINRYMTARMGFFHTYPNEAHIIFEALLNPPPHLSDEIGAALAKFNQLNDAVCRKTLDALNLRDGITTDEALSYFHLMQTILNGYFSSPAFQKMVLNEKVSLHERTVSKLLEYMIYGIAKGESES